MSARRTSFLALIALAAVPLVAGLTGSSQAAGAFPSIGENGVTFSASVPSDVQRDEGEPEISIDPAGNVYTCGPSGFSNIADYAQVSRDGGDQFHLIGQPPRGQISNGEGGGDCGLASAPDKNSSEQYTWAYTGLGPLLNFSTGTSENTGQTLRTAPISESPAGVDRQWLVFTDEKTVFLNYNRLGFGYTVQKSTDGGLTYGAPATVSPGGGRIGPMRAILTPGDVDKSIVYFPSYRGTAITLIRSLDNGATWGECVVHDAELNPSAGFVVADHDREGNIYITYSQKGAPEEGIGNDTYVVVMRNANLPLCMDLEEGLGIGKALRVNRDLVETTVMPWIVAGGDPGKIAVAFYGTNATNGDPDSGTFRGAWDVYVNMSLNALDANPTWSQTKASTHPMHYDSICLGGTLCAAPEDLDPTKPAGDRSLVDYFAMDIDPVTGRLLVVYNNTAKQPNEVAGHVGHPIVVTQETGPSLMGSEVGNGGQLQRRVDAGVPRQVLRTVSVDNVEDALSPYGYLCLPVIPCVDPPTANQLPLDFKKVTVGPEIDLGSGELVDDGGFTVSMEVGDLTDGALQGVLTEQADAANPTSTLMWLFRWVNGHQPVGATVRWDPARGFSFRFDPYTTAGTTSGQADPTAEKIVVWPGAVTIPGDVNQDTGIMRLSVPRSVLKALGPVDEFGRPTEIDAEAGSRFYDAVAYSFTSPAPPEAETYLYPVDNAPAMDFTLGSTTGAPDPDPDPEPTDGGTPPSENPRPGPGTGPGTIPSTGGLGTPLLALLVTAAAVLVLRRRRRVA
jgi:hypothetical protein